MLDVHPDIQNDAHLARFVTHYLATDKWGPYKAVRIRRSLEIKQPKSACTRAAIALYRVGLYIDRAVSALFRAVSALFTAHYRLHISTKPPSAAAPLERGDIYRTPAVAFHLQKDSFAFIKAHASKSVQQADSISTLWHLRGQ